VRARLAEYTRPVTTPALDAFIRDEAWGVVMLDGPDGTPLNAQKWIAQFQEKVAVRDFSSFLWMCHRGSRWKALRALAPILRDAEYWQLLRDVYQDAESLWKQPGIRRLLHARRGERGAFMRDGERAALAAMPERLTIYRGAQLRNASGWSWSLDVERARWFAVRWHRGEGIVIHATVARSDVIGYLDGREEAEIVCDPDLVAVESVEVVRRPQP